MGRYFSDKTEEGIRLIYMQYDKKEIKRGVKLLEEAASEGDSDGLYFLSRCYMGSCYVWEFSGLEDDDQKSVELLKESIKKGSAAGVLGAMRCGELTPEVRATMPFASLKEAWDIIYQKAEDGHPFCQYMIGNTYYYGDILEIDESIDTSRFSNGEEMERELVGRCIPWFEKSISQGVSFGALNLRNLYQNGEHGFNKDIRRANALKKACADKGWPVWMKAFGDVLYDGKKYAESLTYFKAAAEKGQMNAWFDIGYQYEFGEGVQKEDSFALQCYERAAKNGVTAAMHRAGRCYYFGYGTAQDYGMAVNWLIEAAKREYRDSYVLFGQCLLKGWGIGQDYKSAKSYLEQAKECSMSNNALGEIYADGLGVPEDIKKGVEYFKKAADNEYGPAITNLSRFKKTLLGKWVRK